MSRDTVTDSAGRNTSYSYDNRNRLEKKITPAGVLKYAFDPNGNVLSVAAFKAAACTLAHSGGICQTNDWDKYNRLKSVTDSNAERAGDHNIQLRYARPVEEIAEEAEQRENAKMVHGGNKAGDHRGIEVSPGKTGLKRRDAESAEMTE